MTPRSAASILPLHGLIVTANHGFLRRKPDSPTLFDLLGPWPWYQLSLEAIALVPFLVV